MEKKMKVFISWSGEKSKKYGEILKDWLPVVLQFVKPYFTPSDIEKGTRWNSDIAKELDSSKFGIICVTRENIHSDWVLFEAGALSKRLEESRVCPILFGLQNTDVTGPLKQFQTTDFNKKDFKKLVDAINNNHVENKLQQKVLDPVFEKWWPDLEQKINLILSQSEQSDNTPMRSERELLEEILELSRLSSKYLRKTITQINPDALIHLIKNYIELHNDQVEGIGGYQETLNYLKNMKKAIIYISRKVRARDPELEDLIDQLDTLTFKCEKKEDDISEEDIPF
jgi:hypothetical protein